MINSPAKSAYARSRRRDSVGRFVPTVGPDSYQAGVTHVVPARLAGFRERVDARWPELCDSVIDQAAKGDRWALELVFQYAVGDWRLFDDESDDNSRLLQYISEIRAAIRSADAPPPTPAQ